MKAALLDQFGGPEVLHYGDVPDPVAAAGEVVVDVHAATVNAADWKFRAGDYARHANVKFPQIPGRDFSGVVSAVGDGADLKIGDAVFGVIAAGKEGTYCEKIAIKADLIGKKPDALSHINAAALALTGLTAINSIEDTLKLQRGETILIQGGAGGVAGFGIQFAKYLGAKVITTTSAANIDYVKSLGADQVIDYNAQDFHAGRQRLRRGIRYGRRRRGKAIVCRSQTRRARCFHCLGHGSTKTRSQRRYGASPAGAAFAKSNGAHRRIVRCGAIRPPEVKLYKLSQAAEAHRLSQSRHFRGKLVFQVR
jgi:NADPH:quinone reductase-like Zn-dependent oxidoreductase